MPWSKVCSILDKGHPKEWVRTKEEGTFRTGAEFLPSNFKESEQKSISELQGNFFLFVAGISAVVSLLDLVRGVWELSQNRNAKQINFSIEEWKQKRGERSLMEFMEWVGEYGLNNADPIYNKAAECCIDPLRKHHSSRCALWKWKNYLS